MRTPSHAPSVRLSRAAGPRPPRSRARRVLRPLPRPRKRRGGAMAERHSAIDTTTPPCEGRHGSAGAPRAFGGWGAISGPPISIDTTGPPFEGRHGSAGAPRAFGGWGAISGPPISIDTTGPPCENGLNSPTFRRRRTRTDDAEDSGGHRLVDTVRAAVNRLAAVSRELYFNDTERKREYKIAPGELPFFMHRERGMHLDEPDVRVDDTPVNAAILGTALTLFYAGRAQADRGQGIYFYLPKLETPDEARFYRELFDACRERLPFVRNATIRGIILVESLPCV